MKTTYDIQLANLLTYFQGVLEEQREVLTRLLIYLMAQKDDRKREFEKRLVSAFKFGHNKMLVRGLTL